MINDNRQKNYNSRGFNLPYIPYPAYRSNGTTAAPKSEAADSETAETEKTAAPKQADPSQPEVSQAAAEAPPAAETPAAAIAEQAGSPAADPIVSVDESVDACPSEANDEMDESEIVTATGNDDDIQEEIPVLAAEPPAPVILTMEEISVIPDEVHKAEQSENVYVSEHTGGYQEETAPLAAKPPAPEILRTEENIGSMEAIKSTAIETSNKKEKKAQRNFFHEYPEKMPPLDGLYGRGLFHYQQWWFRNQIDICVNGDLISGIPIFADHNTIRLVNEKHSYFIPVEKIDYIRTPDGLDP